MLMDIRHGVYIVKTRFIRSKYCSNLDSNTFGSLDKNKAKQEKKIVLRQSFKRGGHISPLNGGFQDLAFYYGKKTDH